MTDKEKEQVKEFKTEVETDIKKGRMHWETFAAYTILVFFVAAVGFGVWWYLGNQNYNEDYSTKLTFKKTATSSTSSATSTDKSDWKTYTNEVFGFSLKYPPTWTLADNLPKSLTALGTAQSSLKIDNGTKYGITIWVNPDGFGMNGGALNVNYDGTTVASKMITLGARNYSTATAETIDLMGPQEGFVITTSFKYGANNYIISMKGKTEADLAEAEAYYKDIVKTYIWK